MNKFMKKIMRKKDGFTLVELIVVIAILAILAGVAIPAYSGYITKANDAADTTALAAVKTAAQATYATDGAVTEIVITTGTESGKATGVVTEVKVRVNDAESASGVADYKTVYHYDSTKDEYVWDVPDFEVYMNSSMIALKGSFIDGATWDDGEWK